MRDGCWHLLSVEMEIFVCVLSPPGDQTGFIHLKPLFEWATLKELHPADLLMCNP